MTINKLIIKNLYKIFERKSGKPLEVLTDISFEFEPNKSYAVTGVSGSGKSTLLHMLAGLEAPTKGAVSFGEKNISEFSQREKDEYLNKSVGLVFQDPFLIRELNVWQNVALKNFNMDNASKDRVSELLKLVDLSDKLEEFPNSLSGGQLQRISILRSLYNSPKFLLADEPTGNLDAKSGKSLVDLILKCKKEFGVGLIISTHDPAIASSMDCVLKLQNGKLSIV